MGLGDDDDNMGLCDSPNMIPPAYRIGLRCTGDRVSGAPVKTPLRGRMMWITGRLQSVPACNRNECHPQTTERRR
jgi:hypothetical protein